MSSSRFLSPLYVLTFSLLLQLAASYAPYSKCGGANLPPNDPYNVSVTIVLAALINNVTLTGFASISVGQGVNQVHGLALCRGDLNASACQACVIRSSKMIQTNCQNTEAIVFDDECEVRYSDTNFLGQVDQGDWTYFLGPGNASNPVSFNESLVTLLNDLAQTAYANSKFFAAGSTGSGNSITIYALVQCTKDLPDAVDCESCLIREFDWVQEFLYGKNGGKQVGGSCNVRFEIYQFFNIG